MRDKTLKDCAERLAYIAKYFIDCADSGSSIDDRDWKDLNRAQKAVFKQLKQKKGTKK